LGRRLEELGRTLEGLGAALELVGAEFKDSKRRFCEVMFIAGVPKWQRWMEQMYICKWRAGGGDF
jgi:hypothetical protein